MREPHADHALDDELREQCLARRLEELEQAGAEIEERRLLRAVVRLRMRESILPNAVMAVGGLGLFALEHGPLFLAAAVLSALGWRRKREAADVVRRVLVRVDERGRVLETEIGRMRVTAAT